MFFMLKNEDIKKELKLLQVNLIDSIKELVSIPSILSENSSKYPFGENIDKALKKHLKYVEI